MPKELIVIFLFYVLSEDLSSDYRLHKSLLSKVLLWLFGLFDIYLNFVSHPLKGTLSYCYILLILFLRCSLILTNLLYINYLFTYYELVN